MNAQTGSGDECSVAVKNRTDLTSLGKHRDSSEVLASADITLPVIVTLLVIVLLADAVVEVYVDPPVAQWAVREERLEPAGNRHDVNACALDIDTLGASWNAVPEKADILSPGGGPERGRLGCR